MSKDPTECYVVKFDVTMCVLAKNKAQAKKAALDCLYADLQEEPRGLSISHMIRSMGQIPRGWMDRIPHASHVVNRFLEGRTVGEFVRHQLWKPFDKKKRRVA